MGRPATGLLRDSEIFLVVLHEVMREDFDFDTAQLEQLKNAFENRLRSHMLDLIRRYEVTADEYGNQKDDRSTFKTL